MNSSIACVSGNESKDWARFDYLLQFAGLSLFLATIEMLIPKPMPFLKLGIANLPILLFITYLRFREMLLLVFFKVFCQSLISGSLLSYIFVFSACSSLASGCAMWFLGRLSPRFFSLLGVSIFGAFISISMQLFLALSYFFPGMGSLLIPWSLIFGLTSGFLLGLFALQFVSSSRWYAKTLPIFQAAPISNIFSYKIFPNISLQESSWSLKNFWITSAQQHLYFGLLSLVLMFVIYRHEPIYLLFELLLFLWLNFRLGYHPWWRSMILLLLILVFFHLLLPAGKLLWQLNIPPYINFKLTLGALEIGLGKALLLLNLIQISRFSVSRKLQLPGRLGYILQIVFTHYESFLNAPVKLRGIRLSATLDAMLCSTMNDSIIVGKVDPNSKIDSTILRRIELGFILLFQIVFVLMGVFFPLYRVFEF